MHSSGSSILPSRPQLFGADFFYRFFYSTAFVVRCIFCSFVLFLFFNATKWMIHCTCCVCMLNDEHVRSAHEQLSSTLRQRYDNRIVDESFIKLQLIAINLLIHNSNIANRIQCLIIDIIIINAPNWASHSKLSTILFTLCSVIHNNTCSMVLINTYIQWAWAVSAGLSHFPHCICVCCVCYSSEQMIIIETCTIAIKSVLYDLNSIVCIYLVRELMCVYWILTASPPHP